MATLPVHMRQPNVDFSVYKRIKDSLTANGVTTTVYYPDAWNDPNKLSAAGGSDVKWFEVRPIVPGVGTGTPSVYQIDAYWYIHAKRDSDGDRFGNKVAGLCVDVQNALLPMIGKIAIYDWADPDAAVLTRAWAYVENSLGRYGCIDPPRVWDPAEGKQRRTMRLLVRHIEDRVGHQAMRT